jgi:hypothetical protein
MHGEHARGGFRGLKSEVFGDAPGYCTGCGEVGSVSSCSVGIGDQGAGVATM